MHILHLVSLVISEVAIDYSVTASRGSASSAKCLGHGLRQRKEHLLDWPLQQRPPVVAEGAEPCPGQQPRGRGP